MDKKTLSESDIIAKFVVKALSAAGWDTDEQVRHELYISADRVTARGPGGPARVPKTGRYADLVLFHKPGIPVAVIEAKDNNHALGAGMKQALDYAERLGVGLAYSTNGDAFLEHDLTGQAAQIEREVPLSGFPSPAELWRRHCKGRELGPAEETVAGADWYLGMVEKAPRAYQLKAVNRVVEAIAKGQNRVLLVMATGTGKTYTAFQIIWRLWKARAKKRILFLADRNVLVDQARRNDFQPFGAAMTKIENRTANPAMEIYLALYQAVSGTEEEKNIYKQFSPGFFDLIVVDECHRGSAAADSAWREILEYFSGATQIGMTATPKETKTVSNIDYFGKPVFIYTLDDGVKDGYLAPRTVIRVEIDKDVEGYRPERGKRDKYGQALPDRKFKRGDMDRELVLDERTKVVARRITEWLKASGDRYAKTIVFCQDIEHANRMCTALKNENADLVQENGRYVTSITAEDSTDLDDFTQPSTRYPVIATTSKLLSTGVDAQTVKLIVIDQEIGSMSEFKQIVGRGTRLREDYGKLAFTIMDFRDATRHFEDKKFDGVPEKVYEVKAGEAVPAPGGEGEEEATPSPATAVAAREGSRVKYHLADVSASILREEVARYRASGERVDVSVDEHARAVLRERFSSVEALRACWVVPGERAELRVALENDGVLLGDLASLYGSEHAGFDLLAHAGFGAALMSRKARAGSAGVQAVLGGYGEKARAVLEGLLGRFVEGEEELDNGEVLRLPPFDRLGTAVELVRSFGGRAKLEAAVEALEVALYGG